MRKVPRTYTKTTTQALAVLGIEIKRARTQLRMSASDLAERVGISRTTLHKIEKGDPFVEIGLALEAAVIVGVPLFELGASSMAGRLEHLQDKLALLPRAVRRKRTEVNDDF